MRGLGGGRHDGAAGGGGSASGRWAEGREGGAGEAKGRGRNAPGVTEGVARDRGCRRCTAEPRSAAVGAATLLPGPPSPTVLRAPNPERGAPRVSPRTAGLRPPPQRPLQAEARRFQARGGARDRGLTANLAATAPAQA